MFMQSSNKPEQFIIDYGISANVIPVPFHFHKKTDFWIQINLSDEMETLEKIISLVIW